MIATADRGRFIEAERVVAAIVAARLRRTPEQVAMLGLGEHTNAELFMASLRLNGQLLGVLAATLGIDTSVVSEQWLLDLARREVR